MGVTDPAVRVRDPVGSYPVRSILCHVSFWQTAVDMLLSPVDHVVLDDEQRAVELSFQGTPDGTAWLPDSTVAGAYHDRAVRRGGAARRTGKRPARCDRDTGRAVAFGLVCQFLPCLSPSGPGSQRRMASSGGGG